MFRVSRQEAHQIRQGVRVTAPVRPKNLVARTVSAGGLYALNGGLIGALIARAAKPATPIWVTVVSTLAPFLFVMLLVAFFPRRTS